MGKRILVVAAHPDDEVLGCGGTVLRHVAAGDVVHTMIMAEGLTSRDETRDADGRCAELSALRTQAERAAAFMGVEKLILHGFPDNRMDEVALLDVVKKIETEVEVFQPEIVYTHHAGDVNIDHRIVHDAVVTACRSLPGQSVKTILFFETVSSTEWQMSQTYPTFAPNWYVGIGEFMAKKIEALHFYVSEMRAYPHTRSYEGIEILAKQRGITVGMKFAEAFMLGRMVLKSPCDGFEFAGGGHVYDSYSLCFCGVNRKAA